MAPSGLHSVFERFRAILHEGTIDKRCQYIIEGLFAIRKVGGRGRRQGRGWGAGLEWGGVGGRAGRWGGGGLGGRMKCGREGKGVWLGWTEMGLLRVPAAGLDCEAWGRQLGLLNPCPGPHAPTPLSHWQPYPKPQPPHTPPRPLQLPAFSQTPPNHPPSPPQPPHSSSPLPSPPLPHAPPPPP